MQQGMVATSRAAAFLVICSPLWLTPHAAWIAFPFALPVVLGLTLLFLRWDRRPAAALGLDPSRRRPAELAGGAAAAIMLVAAIAAILAAALPFPWVRNPRFDGVQALFSIGSLLYGNAVEELIFRGYGFERLIAGIGHWQAQLATAVLFAVFHVANGWPWQTALAGTTVGSLLFGLVFVRWQSVPAAIGVHAAANWTRDLVLMDPPGPATFLGPLAPRPWTGGEQVTTLLIWNGAMLVTCALLWRGIGRRGVLGRLSAAPGEGDREAGR